MDKFEVIGYTTAGACLVATLAVFFLWIMPANQAIATDLKSIESVSTQLRQLKTDNESALTPPDDNGKVKKPADLKDIIELSKSLIATPAVSAAAAKVRESLTARTTDLISRVIQAHEVAAPELPVDRLRPFQATRKELGELFTANNVKWEGNSFYSLPSDDTTAVDPFQFRTIQVFKQVVTPLFKASTPIKLLKPTVDDSHMLNTQQVDVNEKVSAVLLFTYYDKARWSAIEKKYRDENNRAARLANTTGQQAAEAPEPAYEKTGFKIVFRTNPINVSAALASLEQIDGYLVTVKRLDIIRAGLPFYTFSDYGKGGSDIPLPYRDGDVQVVADVELLGFAKGAAEEQSKKLYKGAAN